ncbi:MAG: FMN-binding protein [Prevotella sp.]|nr:FMN-binding protein [Prevotella sp.]
MKTNSNTYTIIYSAIIVVVVAFLLAFVSQALKAKQDANVALDVKKQILNSLNIRGLGDSEAEAKYGEVVKSEETVGEQKLYTCEIDGQPVYVCTVKGMGLWGPVFGYISVAADKNTVYGAYFNHDSETAGLGAEIKDSQAWQEKFKGKKINADADPDIELGVAKKIEVPESEVDAVTGATLTSNGVSLMLKEGLKPFMEILKNK